jgi:hypothetical protein
LSIKSLPAGANSLKEEEKQSLLKCLVGELLYLDLFFKFNVIKSVSCVPKYSEVMPQCVQRG